MKNNIIIDCFAGGGGASVGIEMALGRSVDIAVNHDPQAILQHSGEMRRCPCSRWHRLQNVILRNTVRTNTSGKNLIRKCIENARSTWIR